MRHDDIPDGLRLCRLASWNQVEADWRFFLDSSPGGCRVAENEVGQVIASVATIAYGDAFGWIAMVLVDPRHRRRGIGTRLLKEALDVLGDAAAVRLDATPAGREVYVPLGFSDEYGLQRMVRAPTVHLEVDTADVGFVRQMTDGDFADIIKDDREVFGADRHALLEMCRREAPEYASVIGGTRIEGYAFGRHGHSFEQLGPLVARDESTARRLVAACLSAFGDRPFIIDTPLRACWLDWLVSQGFSLQRPFVRMRRGVARFHERVDRVFALTGPEFG